jgi:hypothetical protein
VTHIKTFHPRDFQAGQKCHPRSDRHINTFSSRKFSSKKMSSQHKWQNQDFSSQEISSKKCNPRKWQISRHFIQDIFKPDTNAIPESDRQINNFSSKKFQSKKMSSQQKWHLMTCHPRNFIPEASYGMYEEFFIQEIGWLYIGKNVLVWKGLLVSFSQLFTVLMRQYSFIHSSLVADPFVIRWIIKV